MQKEYTSIKGIELSERFYLEYGAPMMREQFPSLEGIVAVGLAGSGSECFGYDDEISRDHDFEPGFCLFIPDGLDRKTEFALERAYSKLPREFMGFEREKLSPVGGNRHGVIKMSDFFRDRTGRSDGNLSVSEWFSVPESSLAEAVNGKVFRDDAGEFTSIRQRLSYMPEDVRLKKLAGFLLDMGQAGQYNYSRALSRGDQASAQLSALAFVNDAMKVIFLLNKRYMPFYKWAFRALRDLPLLGELYSDLLYLITTPNDATESAKKQMLIEKISAAIIAELKAQQISEFSGDQLEGHAYSSNSRISDPDIRNLHILYAV